jgi:two-component system nitrogen regulation sensor histidine kinase NtrY
MSPERGSLLDWIRYDARIGFLALLVAAPGTLVALVILWTGEYSARIQWTVSAFLAVTWLGGTLLLRERLVRPLQTLSNMLAALREGDFSIRARTTGANDPLSLAFMEVNALEAILQEQRLGAVEAEALLRKVMEEIDVAVFAFDDQECLQLLNRAGERLLGQPAARVVGRTAEELRLDDPLRGPAPRTLDVSLPGGTGRWEIRRSVVRQEGLPLKLLVLSDLSRALREEERRMWQRLVRVLSHEINNSLAPIKSIAGSLQTLVRRQSGEVELQEDMESGLQVIQSRAEGLGRFMASYARLARLPAPDLGPVKVAPLVARVVALETRIPVEVLGGPDLEIQADSDQLEQLLINLIRNGVDAALETGGGVRMGWRKSGRNLELEVQDDGPGIGDGANLFVPFYTTKQGGSGIGLVLCRQIAEAHGGTLQLDNRRTAPGARARLSLPLRPEGDGQGQGPGM